MIFADSSSDLLKQLTRIADALAKPGPSLWTEWVRMLASLFAGIAVTYFGILWQGNVGDKREQTRMRRIIYRELGDAIIWLYDIVREMPAPQVRALGSEEFIDPPTMKVLNPPFTFEGEEYMRDHHNVAYELPEMLLLKRMYSCLHQFQRGSIVPIGEFKVPLLQISKAFKGDPVVRKNFKEFTGKSDFATINAIANHFADHEIRFEELMRIRRYRTS